MTNYMAEIIRDLELLRDEWHNRERDSPYGLTENGERLPALDGNDCAGHLDQIIKIYLQTL